MRRIKFFIIDGLGEASKRSKRSIMAIDHGNRSWQSIVAGADRALCWTFYLWRATYEATIISRSTNEAIDDFCSSRNVNPDCGQF
ncbi:MAG TPA: hypothetical protein VLM90_13970, partial [Candidatus Deferrimicrobium sp.]|nr:hypothetical protein [Candidatus Deferrimicrobium sp.]